MSAGTAIAVFPSIMRSRALFLAALSTIGVLALVGCGSDDGAVTDDSSEINEGRGSLEREMDPPMASPTTPLIGAKMSEVFDQAKGTLTVGSPKEADDGCTTTQLKDTKKKVLVERITCGKSDTIRLLNEDGTTKEEHSDLNKDGEVDRYTNETGAIAQYVDNNFDGKVDVIVERVDKLKDFSMKGYEETFPKSSFLYRIREDRNKDGKLDHEKLTARGTLPKAAE
jgi:hypothetical protein